MNKNISIGLLISAISFVLYIAPAVAEEFPVPQKNFSFNAVRI
jgi:hypothetical protein